MSSIVRSVSFRSVRQKQVTLQSVDAHNFSYTTNELFLMHGKLPYLAEMGGAQGLAQALRSDVKTGLHADESSGAPQMPPDPKLKPKEKKGEVEVPTHFARRESLFGKNVYPAPELATFWELCWEAVQDPMLVILLIAGSISVILGMVDDVSHGWYEGISIVLAVVLVTFVGGGNNYSQQQQFAKLDRTEEVDLVSVIRAGQTLQIHPELLQVGDIVLLAAGGFIPADGVIVADDDIKVNESKMTGESIDIKKNFNEPFLFGGTEVREGQATMLVTAVGEKSAYGRIMKSLAKEEEATPLQQKLEKIAAFVGYAGASVAVALFIVLFARWLHDDVVGQSVGRTELTNLLKIFIVCVTVVVVAIPEGLPLAVTISLAYSMKRMYTDNIVVHRLAACETMGNATTICSDKTGTLTQNLMTVVKVHMYGQTFDGQPPREALTDPIRRLLVEGVVVNSKAWISEEDREKEKASGKQPELWTWKDGNQTEVSLMSWLTRYDIDIGAERAKYPVEKSYPFDSIKKQSSVILSMDLIQRNAASSAPASAQPALANRASAIAVAHANAIAGDDGTGSVDDRERAAQMADQLMSSRATGSSASASGYRRYFKGAAEVIASMCTSYVDKSGKAAPLPPAQREQLIETILGFTRRGLRTIAFCYVDFDQLARDDEDSLIDPPDRDDCTFIGCVGIKDPLRPEAYKAVRACQRAGVIVRMVTGDHLETAKFIARECGILTSEYHIAMLGEELRKLIIGNHEQQLLEIVPRLRVLARSKPEDKELLVNWLKRHDEVVAATGDGTNDAPALSAADVGIAMFIAGTAVAKSAAKIWILDDNFASIVKAVRWGRSVYDNIRKFVQFQLTVNVVACSIVLIGGIAGFGNPLTAVQLLWVNLIMDTFAALALGTEAPDDRLLKRRPYRLSAFIISPVMWRNIMFQAAYQLGILLLLLFSTAVIPGEDLTRDQHYTVIFNSFVFMQLFNEINSRKCNDESNVFENLFTNWIFWTIMFCTIFVQVILVEFVGTFASTTSLTWSQWLACVGYGSISLPVGFLQRLVPVDFHSGQKHIDPRAFEGSYLKDRRFSEARPEDEPLFRPNSGMNPDIAAPLNEAPSSAAAGGASSSTVQIV